MKKITFLLLAITLFFGANLQEGKKQFDKKEYKRAFETFMMVARDGMIAKYNVGLMYEFGLGVKKDIKNAIAFYKMSANDGYDKAQFTLGNAYLKGIGVKKNINIALSYYQLAAKQNNKEAKQVLAQLEKLLKNKSNKATTK